MSYIGKEPQYTDFLSKFFSGDGTAMTVTLDASPPNEAALLVFIDGVRQDTSAYTVSGYSLTFTGTVPSGTNNVQVVHLGIAQDTQVPVDDSVSTVKIQDDAVTSAKLANSLNITSGNSLTIDSGATITNNGTASGFGSPAYAANASASTGAVNIDASDNLQFNSGYGSTATAYGCRAWVRFNGAGTVSIYGSANVSSITDNSTGNYNVNFTTAMPDSNYATFVGSSVGNSRAGSNVRSLAAGSYNITSDSSGVAADFNHVSTGVLR